jgi:hypothetical protein
VKKTIASLACVTMIALCLVACGWKPKVAAVPITAPWDKMNLPVKENAVVSESTDREFKAVHKGDKGIVLQKYVEALKSQGWVQTKLDAKDGEFLLDMAKGSDKIHLEIYGVEDTGVTITRQ